MAAHPAQHLPGRRNPVSSLKSTLSKLHNPGGGNLYVETPGGDLQQIDLYVTPTGSVVARARVDEGIDQEGGQPLNARIARMGIDQEG